MVCAGVAIKLQRGAKRCGSSFLGQGCSNSPSGSHERLPYSCTRPFLRSMGKTEALKADARKRFNGFGLHRVPDFLIVPAPLDC